MAKAASYRELKKQMDSLARQVEHARLVEMKTAVEQCKKLIDEYGLTATDLGLIKTQAIPPKKVKKADRTFVAVAPKSIHPPKYVDPESGRTWSGRGHQPAWLVGDRDAYLIQNAAEKPKRATQNNQGEAA